MSVKNFFRQKGGELLFWSNMASLVYTGTLGCFPDTLKSLPLGSCDNETLVLFVLAETALLIPTGLAALQPDDHVEKELRGVLFLFSRYAEALQENTAQTRAALEDAPTPSL